MTSMQTQHQTTASQNKEQYASRNNGQPKVGGTSNAANLSQGAVPARTANGSTGNNPAAGGVAKGGTGGVNNALSTKQATGIPGAGAGPKVTNNPQSPSGAGPGGAGPGGKLTSTGPGAAGPTKFTGGGPGGGGPAGGGPARFTGGGPAGPRTANFA